MGFLDFLQGLGDVVEKSSSVLQKTCEWCGDNNHEKHGSMGGSHLCDECQEQYTDSLMD